jgi:hypothetical protein
VVGNFFASAIAEDCVAQQCSRAQLAQALHAAVHRWVCAGVAKGGKREAKPAGWPILLLICVCSSTRR